MTQPWSEAQRLPNFPLGILKKIPIIRHARIEKNRTSCSSFDQNFDDKVPFSIHLFAR